MDNVKKTIEELKQARIWSLTRVTTDKKTGKACKEPMDAKGFRVGNTDEYKDRWVSFDEAVKAKEAFEADGVAMVIPCGFGVIDIDHRADDDPIRGDIEKRFENTYAERSMSGNGVHIIFKVDVSKIPTQTTEDGKQKLDGKYYVKNPRKDLELYIPPLSRHFMTCTGNVINDKDITDCTKEVLEFLEKYMHREKKEDKRPEKEAATATTATTTDTSAGESNEKATPLTDKDDILGILSHAKNSEKFHSLYRGEYENLGYHSQSEADLGLCTMIAFYAGDNSELIEEIFNGSKLAERDKWRGREDYRHDTIKSAISNCKGKFYSRQKSSGENSSDTAPEFVRKNGRGELTVNEGLLARYFIKRNKVLLVYDQKDSETRTIYLYNAEKGVYELSSRKNCEQIMKEYIEGFDPALVRTKTLYNAAQQVWLENDISRDRLNADESIINFENGILKIDEKGLSFSQGHSPDILSTIQIPCAWEEEQSATPVFDQYLDDLCLGDKGVQKLLLQYLGACISNVKGYRMKKSLFLVGEGDTGKSQLILLAQKLLGEENSQALGLSDIEGNKFSLATVEGKRLVCNADLSAMTVKELSKFKSLTGGDSLFAEKKGRDGFNLKFNGLLWFGMNKRPKFGGDDGDWVYNRIMLVDCNNVIPAEKQNAKLVEEMYEERSGIVRKAVTAFLEVLQNCYKFTEPESVIAARKTYKAENNPIISFFETCMEKRPNYGKLEDGCTMSKVLRVFRGWCKDNNSGFNKTEKEFRSTIVKYLGASDYKDISGHDRAGSFLSGYTLNEDTKALYAREYSNFDR